MALEKGPRLVLAAAILALVVAAAAVDLPRASRGEFWGDGATYYAMAWSLARDFDLRYEASDLERVCAEYPAGPQGLFLKRAQGGLAFAASFPWLRRVRADEARLYYAKAFLYPLLAAPFVAAFGTRGLGLANALLLSLALVLAVDLLRRRGIRSWDALLVVGALFLLTVTPLYVVWFTPELLGLALITAALWAWASGRPLVSAALFGLAGYLKPPNLLLAAPLGIGPLLPAVGGRWLGPGLWDRCGEALRRGLVMVAAAASLYALNVAFTGEYNYQGGERKTFYGRFPYDSGGARFEDSGTWMTTNQLGPLVAGRDASKVTAKSGPARNPAELRESFIRNLGYFWVGRFGGVLAYFFPALVTLLFFLGRGPRTRDGWLALSAVGISWIAYLWLIPDNWYGGGGTVGNRYFLNLLPAFLFLVPAGRTRWVAAAGVIGCAVFLAPVLAAPIERSLHPGEHSKGRAFRALPPELTMLNDLSVFTEIWRKKRAFGFVGNAERGADADAFFLYFFDDATWGREEWAGRTGFWLKGGASAEVVVRAFDLAPVDRIVLRLTGGPMGDSVDAAQGWGWQSERVSLGPGETREVALPAGRGVAYYDTYLHLLRLRSRRGAPLSDGRRVGVFVEPRLAMGPRFPAVPP